MDAFQSIDPQRLFGAAAVRAALALEFSRPKAIQCTAVINV